MAIVLCIIMTILIWGLGFFPTAKSPIVLVLKISNEANCDEISQLLANSCSYIKQASVINQNSETEIIYELKTKDKVNLVSSLTQMKGIVSAGCLEHDGESRI